MLIGPGKLLHSFGDWRPRLFPAPVPRAPGGRRGRSAWSAVGGAGLLATFLATLLAPPLGAAVSAAPTEPAGAPAPSAPSAGENQAEPQTDLEAALAAEEAEFDAWLAEAGGAGESEPSAWMSELAVKTSFLYTDNALGSSVRQVPGLAHRAGLEWFRYWAPAEDPRRLVLLLLGERQWFADTPEPPEEYLTMAYGSWEQPLLGGTWRSTAQHFYIQEGFDASFNELEKVTSVVRLNALQLESSWLSPAWLGWSLEPAVSGERYFYQDSNEDYSEFTGRLGLVRPYGHDSEFALLGEYGFRNHDSRLARTVSGTSLRDTDLAYHQGQAEARWKHVWDQAGDFRTRLRALYLNRRDNGGGYYDYDRWTARAGLDWQLGPVTLTLDLSAQLYDYRARRLTRLRPDTYERWEYAAEIAAEWALGDRWTLLLRYAPEDYQSNDPFDVYAVHTAELGVRFTP